MIYRRVGADDEHHFRARNIPHLIRYRPRVDAFHQRGDTGCVAKAGAVIDVVGAEAGAHQFLEQIRLFVGAFSGPKTSERPLAISIPDLPKSLRRDVQCFFPTSLAENLLPVVGVNDEILDLRKSRLTDKRFGQAMLVLDVIESVAPFDAQTVRVRGPVLSLNIEDFVVLDVVGKLAADAAIGAYRIDFFVCDHFAYRASGHQSSGRAGLDALPASHAS